jgi:hypothetical protein
VSRVRFLLDENVDHSLRPALRRQAPEATVWIIGDPVAPARGTLDPDILIWCELNGFSLVTNNRASMPGHLAAHFALGRHMPGIFVIGATLSLGEIAAELALVWGAAEAEEFQDQIIYLPFTG